MFAIIASLKWSNQIQSQYDTMAFIEYQRNIIENNMIQIHFVWGFISNNFDAIVIQALLATSLDKTEEINFHIICFDLCFKRYNYKRNK